MKSNEAMVRTAPVAIWGSRDSKELGTITPSNTDMSTARDTTTPTETLDKIKLRGKTAVLLNLEAPRAKSNLPWRRADIDNQTRFAEKKDPITFTPKHTPSTRVWTPSRYKRNQDAATETQQKSTKQLSSMEQIMKSNAIARGQEKERWRQNAGDALHQSTGDRGNPRPSWRDAGRNSYNNQRYQHRRPNDFRRVSVHQAKRKERQREQIRRRLPPSIPTSVELPTSSLTLVDFSLLLRVKKAAIVRTLRNLGEQVAYSEANQDTYTIDLEMMELVCIELGIEPSVAKVRESSLLRSEQRAMRQNTTAELDEDAKSEEDEKYAMLPPRSPVVSIMGHVDHGKTTLMDALRRRAVAGSTDSKASKSKKKKKGKKSAKKRGQGGVSVSDDNVAGTEAGGITQVITAFEVPLPFDESDGSSADGGVSTVTFLDTPGHAAFKKMRQSGSSATDVIVLVIAADDGVSPQTVEIIDMYKSIRNAQPQSISLVVAVSKVDKPGIDVDESIRNIENQLMTHEIYTENVGGSDDDACLLFPVSGLTGEGLDELIDGLGLQSEMMDLRADDAAHGEGIVIDARIEKGLGVVADAIIRWGSVTKGDFVVSGMHAGRVKFLNDVGNKPIKKARPSQPVRIVGFKSLPKAGDPVVCAASEDEAKELIRLRESELMNAERAEFENEVELQVTGTAAKQGSFTQKAHEHYGYEGEEEGSNNSIWIPVVIKADSHGTLDAVKDALVTIGTESKLDIVIDPVEMSTGVVTMSDVVMAREADAAIFTFGQVGTADKETKAQAITDQVSIRSHDIIYRLLEDAKDYFKNYLPVKLVDKIQGKANVQAVFDVTDSKKNAVSIAGLRVTEGHLYKEKSADDTKLPCYYRVYRQGKLFSGDGVNLSASSLRKGKDDADSVRNGEECGLGIAGFNDLVEGDLIECYSVVETRADI
ncbi:hypothetical protein THAOC_05466 [Thalassiosira oceanica]|uniref:Tr-type G domain-containing protein n=1 Tax=Thalassiosira oceanica TaxID=159749 RepID=K0TMS9_THAOC|nr:hypothetical protein THAOC_05466 [Thalassiosira oceanica]|eukprot:EJK72952.1 hypothetical protein THAOC_05466 [Thalassiosira oceanica]